MSFKRIMNAGDAGLLNRSMLIFEVCMLLLLAIASSSAEKVYARRGGSIELLASKPPGKITSIIWKHNKDKAAEWFEEDGEHITYFGIFKNIAVLNRATLSLNISNLQKEFSGSYSAEVNNKDPTDSLDLTLLEDVTKPIISEPECTSKNCTLTCTGTGEGPTKLTWSDEQGNTWEQNTLEVEKKDLDVKYTCNFSNPVSWAENSVTVNKVVADGSTAGGSHIFIVIGIVIVVLIAAFVAVLRLFQIKKALGVELAELCNWIGENPRLFFNCADGKFWRPVPQVLPTFSDQSDRSASPSPNTGDPSNNSTTNQQLNQETNQSDRSASPSPNTGDPSNESTTNQQLNQDTGDAGVTAAN